MANNTSHDTLISHAHTQSQTQQRPTTHMPQHFRVVEVSWQVLENCDGDICCCWAEFVNPHIEHAKLDLGKKLLVHPVSFQLEQTECFGIISRSFQREVLEEKSTVNQSDGRVAGEANLQRHAWKSAFISLSLSLSLSVLFLNMSQFHSHHLAVLDDGFRMISGLDIDSSHYFHINIDDCRWPYENESVSWIWIWICSAIWYPNCQC